MKRILTVLLTAVLLLSNMVHSFAFSDMENGYDWAKVAVETLSQKDFLNGYPDGTFRPEKNITKAELAKLVFVMFGAGTASEYTDCAPEEWYAQYTSKIGGYFLENNQFFPNQNASREEVCYAVAYGMKLPESSQKIPFFSDKEMIESDYLSAIHTLTAYGLLSGYPDGTFRPKKEITRAETAAILHRCLTLKETPKEEPSQEDSEQEEETTTTTKSVNRFFVVEKVSQIVDDAGNIVMKVVGYQDGKEETLLLKDVEIVQSFRVSDNVIKPGDIIAFTRYLFGDIHSVSIAVRPGEMPEINCPEMLFYGTTTHRKILAGYVERIYKNRGLDLLCLDQSATFSYDLDENLNVYTLKKNGKIEVSELSDVLDSQYELGDKILAYCYKDVISEILVIKE